VGDELVLLSQSAGNGGYVLTDGPNGQPNTLISNIQGNANHGYISVVDASGLSQAGMYVNSSGYGYVFGDTKNFHMDNPSQPGTEIWYASVEGPEAAAYIRGMGHLVDGRATVSFPGHFVTVASPEGITVQLTPLSADSKGLAVTKTGLDGLIIQELNRGNGTYDFYYHVIAVRRGYENYQVIRDSADSRPADMAQQVEIFPPSNKQSSFTPSLIPSQESRSRKEEIR